MRFLILFGLFVHSAHAKEKSLSEFRFSQAIEFKEVAGVPPKLEMMLEISCNESLAQVIRFQKNNSQTNKATIAVGALVQKDLSSPCSG